MDKSTHMEAKKKGCCPFFRPPPLVCCTEASIDAVQAEMAFRLSNTGIFGAHADCQSGHYRADKPLTRHEIAQSLKSLPST